MKILPKVLTACFIAAFAAISTAQSLSTATTENVAPPEKEVAPEIIVAPIKEPPEIIAPIKLTMTYSVKPDMRKCAFPMCGGYWITPVNKVYTDIPTLEEAEDRYWEPGPIYVSSIDYTKLKLTRDEIARFQDLIFNGRALIAGFQAFYPVKSPSTKPLPAYKKLVATKTWGSANENPAIGEYLDIKLSGIQCVTKPCPYFKALKVNTRYGFLFDRINFEKADLTETQARLAKSLIYDGSLIITGVRDRLAYETADPLSPAEISIQPQIGIIATQVYFPFPGPKPILY